MEEIIKLKTSINCNGCLAKVTPVLNKIEGIIAWDVDLQHQNKTLTVKSDINCSEEIIAKLREIGFSAEKEG
jgi:copper chaperone